MAWHGFSPQGRAPVGLRPTTSVTVAMVAASGLIQGLRVGAVVWGMGGAVKLPSA